MINESSHHCPDRSPCVDVEVETEDTELLVPQGLMTDRQDAGAACTAWLNDRQARCRCCLYRRA
jgi:hypothetical protein